MTEAMRVEGPTGLALVDKPAGITSHDAVDAVRRALGTRRVGHAGTLDPMATGLLVIGVGRATRLLRFLGDLPKSYQGSARLGIETDTLDATGRVTGGAPVEITEAALRAAMVAWTGEIEQVAPAYSAVKVGGEALHRAARRGRTLAAAPRRVRVLVFDLIRYDSPVFDFRVVCSGGTYVRSLVADVGRALGCGAHLSALRRTAVGPFDVAEASPPGDPQLTPMDLAVAHLPASPLTADEAVAASHGCCLGPAGLPGSYRAVDPDGRLVGIYRDEGSKAVPEVILAPA